MTNSKELWTTIIRTQGKRNQTLKDAILSVARQKYRPVSVIVSIQNKDSVVAKRAETFIGKINTDIPLSSFYADPAKKRGNPINVGLDHCESEYVGILDDDDIYYPEMGSTLIPHLRDGYHNLAYGNTTLSWRTEHDDGFSEIRSQKKGFGQEFNPVRLAAENYIHPSSMIYRFKDFKDIRTHDSHVLWEDWYLLLSMLFTDKLRGVYIDKDVSEYRLIGDEQTNSFHKFSIEELKRNYEFVVNSFKDKRFSVGYQDVFKIYPEISLVTDEPNDSDIQKLLSKIQYDETLLNRRFIKLYLKLASRLGSLPPKPS